MKNQKFLAALFAAILFTIAVVVVSCKKTDNVQEPVVSGLDDKSIFVIEEILAFRDKLNYHHANPGLKDGEQYTADSAVYEMEALINYSYCLPNIEIDKATIRKSQMIMPLDESQKISASELSDIYDIVIDSIQEQMTSVNFVNRKLVSVDLKLEEIDNNGDATIIISSFIANAGILSYATVEEGWWWGQLEGDCQHSPETDGIIDATTILTTELNKYGINDPPPSGYKWKYVELGTVGPLEPTLYLNDNDDIEHNNHQDYLIYYATTNYTPLTQPVKCVSTDAEIGFNLEMEFYLTNCGVIGSNIAAGMGGNEVSYLVEYLYTYIPQPYEERIQHDLTIVVGKKYLVLVGDELTDKDIMLVD